MTPPENPTESLTKAAPVVSIRQLAEHVGAQVTLQGWLYHKTGKGKLQFLQVRDGTGICQVVLFRGNVSDEQFEAAKQLTQESSVRVVGAVKADPARARCAGWL